MRCWWCGCPPDDVLDVTRLGDLHRRVWLNWPAGDHLHAERPPTPGELLEYGAAVFDRITRIAAE